MTTYQTTTEYRTHWIDAAGRRYEQRHPYCTGLTPVLNLAEIQAWIDLHAGAEDGHVFYARQFLRVDQHQDECDRLAPLIAEEMSDDVPRYRNDIRAAYVASRERWPLPALGGEATVELRNLTPHAVMIGEVTIPPCGVIARATEESTPAAPLLVLVPDPGTALSPADRRGTYAAPHEAVRELPTSTTRYTGLVDLPDPQPGVLLIVSAVTAQVARDVVRRWTGDLLTPGQQVRDGAGRVIGCRSLDRV